MVCHYSLLTFFRDCSCQRPVFARCEMYCLSSPSISFLTHSTHSDLMREPHHSLEAPPQNDAPGSEILLPEAPPSGDAHTLRRHVCLEQQGGRGSLGGSLASVHPS